MTLAVLKGTGRVPVPWGLSDVFSHHGSCDGEMLQSCDALVIPVYQRVHDVHVTGVANLEHLGKVGYTPT